MQALLDKGHEQDAKTLNKNAGIVSLFFFLIFLKNSAASDRVLRSKKLHRFAIKLEKFRKSVHLCTSSKHPKSWIDQLEHAPVTLSSSGASPRDFRYAVKLMPTGTQVIRATTRDPLPKNVPRRLEDRLWILRQGSINGVPDRKTIAYILHK